MKFLLLILSTLYLTGCHTRQINGVDGFIEDPESIVSHSDKSLPKTWRGKKLFDSPYAYFYANNIDDVEEAYDMIRETNESFHDNTDKNLQKGVVIITGIDDLDKDKPFKIDEVISLYQSALSSGVLTEQERVAYEKDYTSLTKRQTKEKEAQKNSEYKTESPLFLFPFFIKPLILAKLLSNNPDNKNFISNNNIWWACFMSLEDVSDTYLDTQVDNLYDQITEDKGSVAKGVAWTITAPIIYPLKNYAKFKMGSALKKAFVKKLKQNAIPHEGIVTVNQEVILD
jgi:hypothetical protein